MSKELPPIEHVEYHPVGRQMFEHGVSGQELRGYPTDEEGNEIPNSWSLYMNEEEDRQYTSFKEGGLKELHALRAPQLRTRYDIIGDRILAATTEFEQATDDTEAFTAKRKMDFWAYLRGQIEEDPHLWSQIQQI